MVYFFGRFFHVSIHQLLCVNFLGGLYIHEMQCEKLLMQSI